MSHTSTWNIELPENISLINQEHLTKVCSCRRRVFSTEEDKYLTELVISKQCTNWFEVAQKLPGRTPRQCRDRWTNYLCPTNSFEPWTPEEDQLVVDHINEIGTRWATIAKLIPGRSDNCIKNRWYSGLKAQCTFDAHGKYCIRKKANSKKAGQTTYKKKTNSIPQTRKSVQKESSAPIDTKTIKKQIQYQLPPQNIYMNSFPAGYIENKYQTQQPIPTVPQNQMSTVPQSIPTVPQNQMSTVPQPIPTVPQNQMLYQTPSYNQFAMMPAPEQMKMPTETEIKKPEPDQGNFFNDDYWEKQIYNQLTEMNQDPFSAVQDFFGEWF